MNSVKIGDLYVQENSKVEGCVYRIQDGGAVSLKSTAPGVAMLTHAVIVGNDLYAIGWSSVDYDNGRGYVNFFNSGAMLMKKVNSDD